MMLLGRATWEQHVRGTKHRRFQAATETPTSSTDRTTRWTCPLCAARNEAASSLFMHVNGARHRRAVGRIREAGRLDETAPLVPRLRDALAEMRRTGDDDAQFADLLRAAEADAGDKAGRAHHPDDKHKSFCSADAATRGAPATSSSPAAGPSADVACGSSRVADGVEFSGKRARDSEDAGASSQRRRVSDGDVGGWSRFAGVRYGCGSRSVRQDTGDAGGASDVGGSRGSSSSRVPTTFIVPPGARAWLECPRCLTLFSSAAVFTYHLCNPPSQKGKGRALPADGRERGR